MVDYEKGWAEWDDMVRYSPAPFHRRRLIMELIGDLPFASALDVGCGNGEMLGCLRALRPQARLAALDRSERILEETRKRYPDVEFTALDVAEGFLDDAFDLVICSEVVEHLRQWRRALGNMRSMCRGTLVLTVPQGRVFPIDEAMGHEQHFDRDLLSEALRDAGFLPEQVLSWGFPFHSLYKRLINLRPHATLKGFAGGDYGPFQRMVAGALRGLFYLNSRHVGHQLIVRARAVAAGKPPRA